MKPKNKAYKRIRGSKEEGKQRIVTWTIVSEILAGTVLAVHMISPNIGSIGQWFSLKQSVPEEQPVETAPSQPEYVPQVQQPAEEPEDAAPEEDTLPENPQESDIIPEEPEVQPEEENPPVEEQPDPPVEVPSDTTQQENSQPAETQPQEDTPQTEQ